MYRNWMSRQANDLFSIILKSLLKLIKNIFEEKKNEK